MTNSYFYLAGPMTGYPQFNFPEFGRVAQLLRSAGYNLVTPHELDDSLLLRQIEASKHGSEIELNSQSPQGFEFLRRDAKIVMDPDCVGVVCLPGWEDSFGASQIEVYLANRFRKHTLAFVENDEYTHGWALVDFDYNKAMLQHQTRKSRQETEDMVRELNRIREARAEDRVQQLHEDELHSMGKITRAEFERMTRDLGTL